MPSMCKEKVPLAADLRHAPAGVDIAVSDAMAPGLAPDAASNQTLQFGVAGPGAHHVAHVELIVAEQAKTQLAVGRKPNAVAGRAEGRGNRGDEANFARGTGDLPDNRRIAGIRGNRNQGPES